MSRSTASKRKRGPVPGPPTTPHPVGTQVADGSPGLVLTSAAGRWVVLATVLGSALAGIDATVVTLALPTIGRDLGATFAGLQWTITGYTITLASLILLGGVAGDRFGRRRVFLVGTIWFATASLLCAIAPSVELLIAARVLQGIGGALLTPASLAVIEAVFRPQDRAAAVGTWAGFSGVAGALSPFVGGWLLGLGSWRWVFVVNIPVAAVVVLVAIRHMPETRDESAVGRRLDWIGAAAVTCFLGALTYGLIEARSGGQHFTTLAAGVLAVVGLVAFVRIETSSPAPLLSPSLFRIRQFCAANATTFLAYGAIGVFFFLVVLQLQVVVGWSPLASGASLLPVTAITLSLSRLSGRIAQRVGPRPQMTAGPLVCGVGVLLALRITAGAGYLTDVLPAVTVFGLGLATMVAPLTSTALSSVPASHAGVASGFNNAVARTGSLLAIAAVPVAAGITGDALSDPIVFASGYRTSMLVCAVLFAGGAVIAAAWIRRPPSRLD